MDRLARWYSSVTTLLTRTELPTSLRLAYSSAWAELKTRCCSTVYHGSQGGPLLHRSGLPKFRPATRAAIFRCNFGLDPSQSTLHHGLATELFHNHKDTSCTCRRMLLLFVNLHSLVTEKLLPLRHQLLLTSPTSKHCSRQLHHNETLCATLSVVHYHYGMRALHFKWPEKPQISMYSPSGPAKRSSRLFLAATSRATRRALTTGAVFLCSYDRICVNHGATKVFVQLASGPVSTIHDLKAFADLPPLLFSQQMDPTTHHWLANLLNPESILVSLRLQPPSLSPHATSLRITNVVD